MSILNYSLEYEFPNINMEEVFDITTKIKNTYLENNKNNIESKPIGDIRKLIFKNNALGYDFFVNKQEKYCIISIKKENSDKFKEYIDSNREYRSLVYLINRFHKLNKCNISIYRL